MSVGGLLKVVDLKLIDPYVRVITHGGKLLLSFSCKMFDIDDLTASFIQ